MDKLCSPVETQLIEYSMSLGFEDLTEKKEKVIINRIMKACIG